MSTSTQPRDPQGKFARTPETSTGITLKDPEQAELEAAYEQWQEDEYERKQAAYELYMEAQQEKAYEEWYEKECASQALADQERYAAEQDPMNW